MFDYRMRACLAGLCLWLPLASADAATITVNSSSDSVANDGACTLREAIVAANTDLPSGITAGECAAGTLAGQDQIVFAIAGSGVHTILVASGLPDIVSSLSIDGYTQAGASPNTVSALTQGFDGVLTIVIDGSQSGPVSKPGLRLVGPGASNVQIRGLRIQNFVSSGCCADTGIALSGDAQNITLIGNVLADNQARGFFNGTNGGLQNNVHIGGPNAADRNLIYGNLGAEGIALNDCQDCLIENNWIGVRAGPGGAPMAAGNAIGIALSNTPGTEIRGNWIAGNAGNGVALFSALQQVTLRDNLIGETFANARGVSISNNAGNAPTDNLLMGNRITGNTDYGVGILNFQPGNAVIRNVLRANRIYANGGIEVDLGANGGGANGVTTNDAGDVDSGPNALQNFPVLGVPSFSGSIMQISYAIDAPAASYTVDFSFSSQCDASGNGPAGTMLSNSIAIDGLPASGIAQVQLLSLPPVGFVSATATAADGTSEFSACQPYSFVDRVYTNGFE